MSEHFPERIQIGRWDSGRIAGPFPHDMKNGRSDLETAVYVRADLAEAVAERDRYKKVYDAAFAWHVSPRPVTDGSEARLRAAIHKVVNAEAVKR